MPLVLSIALNVVLLGYVIWSREEHPRTFPQARPAKPVTATHVAEMASDVSSNTPIESKPFRWSQLDSPDYHIYVKNLRAIGCPEPTVRAIVTGDVQVVYQIYGRQLEKKIAELEANPSWTNALATASQTEGMRNELQEIPDRETALIADLLGEAPAAEQPVRTRRQAPNRPPVMPLVLQKVDLAALHLNSDQMQTIENIKQSFLAQIGGANQDPNDPAYLARWQQAQPEADGMLQGMLGTTVFENYQLAAENSSSPAPLQP